MISVNEEEKVGQNKKIESVEWGRVVGDSIE